MGYKNFHLTEKKRKLESVGPPFYQVSNLLAVDIHLLSAISHILLVNHVSSSVFKKPS